MMRISIPLFLILSVFIVPLVTAQLKVGFYSATCPRAEQIVRQVVQKRFAADRSITAAFLRMYFHDCFVRGCDASILIDSTPKKQSEKDAGPNQTVRGFEIIDEIKTNLEAACPSKVSCADIIALATRDSVSLAGGPSYQIPTGRRDGLVSNPNDVNLPGPTVSVSQALQIFKAKKLTLNDMVTLLGGHSVGIAHCNFFQDRLSNFQGTGKPDSTMDPVLVSKLTRVCATQPGTAFLDQNTSFILDNEFYNQIKKKRGVMQIDQQLALDASSAPIVNNLAKNPAMFKNNFAAALVKLGNVGALVGQAGEIRKKCNVFNKKGT
ncbi:peroxidase 44-like [Impatiens glandulifera]|uniref:peroxidase 44-like n=1 Tax=Impatiens glandulifera TaxID=253017 RepID=UPI001FB1370E|nr:peroxidase 44-like [Impatiens glandulifera]